MTGHEGIKGNERADKEAKAAAVGLSSPSVSLPKALRRPLPVSATRLRQSFAAHLSATAAAPWSSSRRGKRTTDTTGPFPSKHYASTVARLSRRHAGLYMQLRSGHVPLAAYLTRIGRTLTATCPTCGEGPETVYHFLRECPTYAVHPSVYLDGLGRAGRSVRFLLSSDEARRPLFKFINAIGRFRRIFRAFSDVAEDEE